MLQKLLCLVLILKSSQARYGYVPKFYGLDSAVIVDTDKPLPQTNKVSLNYPAKLRLPPPFPLWQHFPRYHIIPPPPPGQILALNTWPKSNVKPAVTPSTTSSSTTTTSTSTTTTTTPKPTTTTSTTGPPSNTISSLKPPALNSKLGADTVAFVTANEYPRELLDIAQNKLGLKRLYEIPTISELGQLLGTNSTQETLKYIKQLTSNDQGVALMKAYIESADYTDNSGDLDSKQDDPDDYNEDALDNMSDIEQPLKINNEGLVVIADEDSNDDYETDNVNAQLEEEVLEELQLETTTSQPRKTSKIISKLKDLPANKTGFFENIANYMHINNLWQKSDQKNENNQNENANSELNELNRVTFLGKMLVTSTEPQQIDTMEGSDTNLPILVRDPIPYNYPVPLRPLTSSTTTSPVSTITTTTTLSPHSSSVHLNTPKMLIPHVQQLARVTEISPQIIEEFLATKPKLLALANKVSRFPIGYDRNSPMEAQVMMAVQRAIEQDDDLKKLLNSTDTLK